jgi:hypothetical protein
MHVRNKLDLVLKFLSTTPLRSKGNGGLAPPFLTSALDGIEWPFYPPGKFPLYRLDQNMKVVFVKLFSKPFMPHTSFFYLCKYLNELNRTFWKFINKSIYMHEVKSTSNAMNYEYFFHSIHGFFLLIFY